jgi:hypothetical protein
MATERAWLSTFFEKALVGRVNQREPVRNVRFGRSASLVLTCAGLGAPSGHEPAVIAKLS